MDIANYVKIALILRACIFELLLAEELEKQDFAVYLAGPITDLPNAEAAA